MERFNASVLLLARAFGWRNVIYQVRNQSTGRSSLPAALRERADPFFQFDRRLFQRALELFEERVAAEGNLLADALHDYKNVLARHANQIAGRCFERFSVGKHQVEDGLTAANQALQGTAVARFLGW